MTSYAVFRRPRGWAALACAFLVGCAARNDSADRLSAAFQARTPILPEPGLTLEAAYEVQDALVERLIPSQGRLVGFKAGLTTPATQQRFGVTHPLRGVLLERMLLPSGSTVAADFGARPLYEGDLILRVGSEAINQAQTDAELLAALDAVVPFIELPDLVYSADAQLDGPALAAINVGARLGILGDPVPLPATRGSEFLEGIRVQVLGADGTALAEGSSTALLGHPLNAVRWLRDELQAAGQRLEPGMLLSLGSLTPLTPPPAGQTVTVRYHGLRATPVDLTVTFR